MLAAGLGFTIFSEWYNVYVVGAWAYQPTMPLVAGIGLTPLLQWVVVPTLMLLLPGACPPFAPPRAKPLNPGRIHWPLFYMCQ